jgi:N6-adenosine-specific RNA methylase IME4
VSEFKESPDTVHGRLLESVHFFGYSAERACSELKYLLQENRWKEVGGGFEDIDDFIETVSLKQFKLPIEEQKEIVKMLSDLRASQRKTANMIGVSEGTIRYYKKDAQNYAPPQNNSLQDKELKNDSAQNYAPEPKQSYSLDPTDVQKTAEKEIQKEQKQVEKQQEIQNIKASEVVTPKGFYDVVIADPPWPYGTNYNPSTRRVANPYPEQTIEEIERDRPNFTDDAVLWFWTTHRFIWDAKNILESWGFEYKGMIVWDKEKMGMGSWLRMQCEFCLLGIKGKPFFDKGKVRDIIREPRREHSRKPDSFFQIVKQVCNGRIIDWHSRENKDGIESRGNEIGKFN